ncbi:MAG: hypothetical protein RLZZ69_2529 [Cyanobacteriota bacterium]
MSSSESNVLIHERTSDNSVLSNDQRQRVYELILEKSQNGIPKKGSFKEIASLFKVHPKTIKRIWTRGRQSLAEGASSADVSSRFKGKSPKTDTDLKDRVQNIPLRLRSSIRSLSAALGMPKSTLHDRFKAGELRRHSNSIKPLLTDENRKARLRFCLSMVIENEPSPVFEDMLDCVHIDEKWFYLTKETQRYYLAPEESIPVRDIDTLINATVTAFYQIDREKLNRVFLTLQQCMTCIMETDGGNCYRLPHMGKDRLERDGTLPDSLDCDSALIAKVKTTLGHQ